MRGIMYSERRGRGSGKGSGTDGGIGGVTGGLGPGERRQDERDMRARGKSGTWSRITLDIAKWTRERSPKACT